nr:prepilin peptidase [Aurantimonas sp. CSK15Z-1]
MLLLVFPLLMLYAAVSDLLSMTIPNWLSLVLIAAFGAFAVAAGVPLAALGAHALVAALCLIVTFGFFAAGWMGGGDAKLITATAIWFGPSPEMAQYVTYAAIYGGVLTLMLIALRAVFKPTFGVASLDRLLDRATGVPYGVALGAAGLVTFAGSYGPQLWGAAV